MLQIPETMRRQIALSPQMPQGLALLWELPERELERRLEAQADDLLARGARNKAVTAFQELAPLMLANAATQDFVATMGDPQLTRLLPDLPNEESLVALARQEYQLEPADESSLRKLLAKLPPLA